jgi:hypothetical protein
MVCEHEYMNMSTPLIDSGDAAVHGFKINISISVLDPSIELIQE